MVSALFHWPCSISIHLSPRWFLYFCLPGSVPALRCPPFSALHAAYLFICLPCDFFTFVFQVRCLHWCLPFSAGHAAYLFICLPGDQVTSLLLSSDFCAYVSQVRCLHCWGPPFSAGHAAFLFICLPCDFFTFVSQVRVPSALFRRACSISIHLFAM